MNQDMALPHNRLRKIIRTYEVYYNLSMQYTLIRARKRTLSLQINGEGQLIARAPLYLPKFFIDRFISQKSAWIMKRKQEMLAPKRRRTRHFSDDELQVYIKKEIKKYGEIMNLHPKGLRFTTVTSYWGTCSPEDILSFNMALAFTPAEAVSYVVVHELSHLRWRGHGKRFWGLVQSTYPKTNEMRALLRHIPRATTT